MGHHHQWGLTNPWFQRDYTTWFKVSNKCKTCGYVGDKIHEDIYDCQTYLDPNWMRDWLVRLRKEKKSEPYLSRFAKWSKKFPLFLFFN